jgi:hypothetical protein
MIICWVVVIFLKRKLKKKEYMKENHLKRKRKGELEAVTRKAERELAYEVDPYEWKLIKLPNGKTRSIKAKEKDIFKTAD